MPDENKNFPELPKLPADIDIPRFKVAGSILGKVGLGAEPSIIPDSTLYTPETESTADEQPTDSTFSPTASDFAAKMGELFENEHSLRERPKPLFLDPEKTNTTTPPESSTTTTSVSSYPEDWNRFRTNHPKPSIDERIQTAEEISDIFRSFERELYKRSRIRHNFDTDFHIAAKYAIKPSSYGHYSFDSREAYETIFEQLTSNRKILYGYLQHLGMCVVDDTGRDPLYGDKMDASNRGFLMLPKDIEHKDYFAFEDEIRDQFPFTIEELEVKLLKAKKEDPSATIETIVIQSAPEQMRELVDSLALDERFTHLFEKAEVIRAARKEKPRAEVADNSQAEKAEPELPTFDPAQNKITKWR